MKSLLSSTNFPSLIAAEILLFKAQDLLLIRKVVKIVHSQIFKKASNLWLYLFAEAFKSAIFVLMKREVDFEDSRE